MKVSNGPKIGKNEAGIALLMCLFSLLLLTAIGVGLMYMADSDSQVNANYRDSQRAYFAAQAGIQEARLRINGGLVPGALPSTLAPTGVYYITNSKGGAEVIQPWVAGSRFFDNQLCHENFPSLGLGNPGLGITCGVAPVGNFYTPIASTSPSTNTAAALDYKWVRITRKMNLSAVPDLTNPSMGAVVNPDPGFQLGYNNTVAICWDGKKQKPVPMGYLGCDDPNLPEPMEYIYRVTSLAVTADGSRRMLQAEVADPPPFVTNSAVESWDHVTLNGQLTVDGYDYCSCSCTTTTDQQTKITTTTCVNRVGKVCDASKYAIYSGGDVEDTSPSETIIAGTSPKIMENAPWDPNLIPELIDRYKDLAVKVTSAPYNWTCTNNDCGTRTKEEFGIPPELTPLDPLNPVPRKNTTITPQITYVPGSVTLTAGTMGDGILIIDGDLNIQGGFEFYGLVLVRGVVKFTGGGSGGSGATNIYGAVLAGQQSYVDNIFGGSANIHFDKCALSQDLENNPPKIITAHEVMY